MAIPDTVRLRMEISEHEFEADGHTMWLCPSSMRGSHSPIWARPSAAPASGLTRGTPDAAADGSERVRSTRDEIRFVEAPGGDGTHVAARVGMHRTRDEAVAVAVRVQIGAPIAPDATLWRARPRSEAET